MSKSNDKAIEDQEFKHKELEASEPEFDDKQGEVIHEEDREEEIFDCELCQDTGSIEIMGGSDSDEWGAVGLKRCSCQDE